MIKRILDFLDQGQRSLFFWLGAVLLQGLLFAFPWGWLAAIITARQKRKFYSIWAFSLGLLLDFFQGGHLGRWAIVFLLTGGVVDLVRRYRHGRGSSQRLNLPY